MGPFKGLHGNRELVAFQFDVEISRLASNAAADYFSPSLFTSGLEPIAHVDRCLDIGEIQSSLVRHVQLGFRNPGLHGELPIINDRPWGFVK